MAAPKGVIEEFNKCMEGVFDGISKLVMTDNKPMQCEYVSGPKKGTVVTALGPKT